MNNWETMSREEMAKIMNKGEPPDINKILRRAEHEIGYGAKRAIEMYHNDVWTRDHGTKGRMPFFLFSQCTSIHCLSHDEIERCKNIMTENGMD